jgi:hypothetical protein
MNNDQRHNHLIVYTFLEQKKLINNIQDEIRNKIDDIAMGDDKTIVAAIADLFVAIIA